MPSRGLMFNSSLTAWDGIKGVVSHVLHRPAETTGNMMSDGRDSALAELLTIDLYNLQLSQIGYPLYANFKVVTYRRLLIGDQDLKRYEAILARPKLQNRNSSVTLGLISSSTDRKVIGDFSKTNYSPRQILVSMTIHIQGMDGELLQ